MADERAYRIQIVFQPETESYVAMVPELDIHDVEASTREEALQLAAEHISGRIQDLAEDGSAIPQPVDEETKSDPIEIHLAPPLLRDLKYRAKLSGLETETYAAQLLSHALGELGRSSTNALRRNRDNRNEERSEDQDRRDHERKDRGRNHGGRKEGYDRELDDKANFMQYLRGLDKGGPRKRR